MEVFQPGLAHENFGPARVEKFSKYNLDFAEVKKDCSFDKIFAFLYREHISYLIKEAF